MFPSLVPHLTGQKLLEKLAQGFVDFKYYINGTPRQFLIMYDSQSYVASITDYQRFDDVKKQ